jgi:hypothetical protein
LLCSGQSLKVSFKTNVHPQSCPLTEMLTKFVYCSMTIMGGTALLVAAACDHADVVGFLLMGRSAKMERHDRASRQGWLDGSDACR